MILKRLNISCKLNQKSKENIVHLIEKDDFIKGRSCYDPDTAQLDNIHRISSQELVGSIEGDKYVTIINSRNESDVELVKYNSGKKNSYFKPARTDITGKKKPQYVDKRVFKTRRANKSNRKLKKTDLSLTSLTPSEDTKR